MRHNPFESQLERLARTLTEQYGVDVVCQGDQAFTDGRTIVLPSLPEPLEGDLERMMVGYLDHETAHVAISDFQQVKRFNRKHAGFEAMLNVVEDALIEKLAMQRWPGVRANLDALFRQVRDRVEQSLPTACPFRRFCTAIYLKLSHHTDLLGLDGELRGYEDLLDQFPQVASTKDSAKLSELLLNRWLQRNANQSKSGSGTAGRVGNSRSSGTGFEAESAPNQTGELAANPGNAPSTGDGSESPPQAKSGGGSLSPETIARITGGTTGSLIAEAVRQAIQQTVNQVDPQRQYRPYTRNPDRIAEIPIAPEPAVQALLARNVDAVRRLRRGLANALRSAEKRWWREEQTRGGLSPRTLYRLAMDADDLRIFRNRASVQGRSMAISIVLDASGSMTVGKMEVARDALRVLLDALHDLKIPTEAFTFTTGDAVDIAKAASSAGVTQQEFFRRYARLANLEIGLIKNFEEPVKAALQRLPSVRGTGLTPLGEALQIGAARLANRRETRRILLAITDGRPGCEGGGSAALIHAQQITKRIQSAGLELIGVGIQDESLCAIVADTIVVDDINQLPARLCRLLGRTLMKGMHHVG